MLVTMNRAVFDSLDHAALAWACIEPTIHRIQGKELNSKLRVYPELTTGQRALLMFWVLHGHARNGVAQFYREVAYLLARADVWTELKAGIRYFGDDALLRLLEEMEAVYRVLAAGEQLGGGEQRGADGESLGVDPELLAVMDRLDAAFPEATRSAIERIGTHIRENPAEFVLIEG